MPLQPKKNSNFKERSGYGYKMNRIPIFLKNNYYLATALLMFLSFPSYDFILLRYFFIFAWFSLFPLFAFVSGKPLKDVFYTSFVTGLLGNLLAYGWIGNFGAKVQGGYFVVLLFLIPSLTAFFTIKVVVAEFFSQKFPSYKIFIYPSVSVIIDFVQSIGFLAFPWTYIGYSQFTFTPFIQMASVTGILGVNFLMVLFNIVFSEYVLGFDGKLSGIRDIYRNRYFRRVAALFLLVAVITVSGSVRLLKYSDRSSENSDKILKLALVQSCISPWENWSVNKFEYLSELMYYTRESLKSNPDFIVWSESATLELISFRALRGEKDGFDDTLFNFIRECGKPLLTGEIGIKVKRGDNRIKYSPQNNAVLISGNGEVLRTYSKMILVPFGEWFPYEKWFAPVKQLVESFGGSDFVPGDKPELFQINGLKFAPLICYEGVFFRLCREYRKMGADFMVYITNDGWTDDYSDHYQHYSAAVIRAIENGIWIVRAGNTGVTALVDPEGRARRSIPILKKGYLTGEIDISQNVNTIYTACGDLVLYASMLFFAVITFISFFRFLKERRGAE